LKKQHSLKPFEDLKGQFTGACWLPRGVEDSNQTPTKQQNNRKTRNQQSGTFKFRQWLRDRSVSWKCNTSVSLPTYERFLCVVGLRKQLSLKEHSLDYLQ
uniref:Uncharacterized protein n=1 Tax=Cyclopterus lumpus TaxID=8103 RepID=A0A8C2ZR53_CYCLU